jgi:hypothetical protein
MTSLRIVLRRCLNKHQCEGSYKEAANLARKRSDKKGSNAKMGEAEGYQAKVSDTDIFIASMLDKLPRL